MNRLGAVLHEHVAWEIVELDAHEWIRTVVEPDTKVKHKFEISLDVILQAVAKTYSVWITGISLLQTANVNGVHSEPSARRSTMLTCFRAVVRSRSFPPVQCSRPA